MNDQRERTVAGGNPQKLITRTELQVSVDQLRHNVPVDWEHVGVLARSIKKSGQLAPLLLCFQNIEIIDGFHRLEALRLLKADTAHVNLIECSQEEFRDARITSAVTHKGVVFPRVVKWAQESFEASPWVNKMQGAEAFHLDRANQFPRPYRQALRRGLTPEDILNITGWVRDKSAVWGLKPEVIANMLDLADLTAPSLIPHVGPKHDPETSTVTRATLRHLVTGVSDHPAQEAIIRKAVAEKYTEAEVNRLIAAYARAGTPEEQQQVLSTVWLTPPKPEPVYIRGNEEGRQEQMREIERGRERFRIEMAATQIAEMAGVIPGLKIDNHPDLKELLDGAINMMLIAVAEYQGSDVDVIRDMRERIRTMEEKAKGLRSENLLLKRNNTALRKAMSLSQLIIEEESDLRKDS